MVHHLDLEIRKMLYDLDLPIEFEAFVGAVALVDLITGKGWKAAKATHADGSKGF